MRLKRFKSYKRKKCFVIFACISLIFAVFVYFLSRNYTAFLLFQNADEVRATGGFLGSLARVNYFGWRQKPTITFFDVYSLDSQLPEYPNAPVGVQTYLTGGRNELHLQDANWERDFAVSGKQIATLLEQAGQPKADVLVAVNSTLVEKVLDYLSEKQSFTGGTGEELTGSNFSTLARRDHNIFASNRQPKTRFLQSFGREAMKYFTQAPLREKWQLISFIYRQKNERLWQAYSPHTTWQMMIKAIRADGTLRRNLGCEPVYWVMSNVGINKSNHQVEVQMGDWEVESLGPLTTASSSVTISNFNQLNEQALLTERLHLADYQRLILSPKVQVKSLRWQGEEIETWDERTIVDSHGREWQEIGFLIIVNEQSQGRLEITLEGQNQCWRWQ